MGALKQEVGEATTAIAQAYGGRTETEDAIQVSAAAGTVRDPQALMSRVIGAVNGKTDVRTVPPGSLGGETRCIQSQANGQQGTVCAWVDDSSVGVVTFLSDTPRDRSDEFVKIREQVEHPAG